MIRKIASTAMFTAAIALVCAAVNAQEFPIMDKIADKVIQKYQTSTCEQLWQERAQKGKAPPPADGTGSSPDVKVRFENARGLHQ